MIYYINSLSAIYCQKWSQTNKMSHLGFIMKSRLLRSKVLDKYFPIWWNEKFTWSWWILDLLFPPKLSRDLPCESYQAIPAPWANLGWRVGIKFVLGWYRPNCYYQTIPANRSYGTQNQFTLNKDRVQFYAKLRKIFL